MNCKNHIEFNQKSIIDALDPHKHEALWNINKKFGGLCELICNKILIDNLLGNTKDSSELKENISLEKINTDEIKKSHLLKIYSVFRRVIAYLLGIYPDNILSFFDQWKLVVRWPHVSYVDPDILKKGLTSINEGETLKLAVFHRNFLSFNGHSMLIKKITDDNYIFFDPNRGEYRGLSFNNLEKHINERLIGGRPMSGGSDIFITKADNYLNKIKK